MPKKSTSTKKTSSISNETVQYMYDSMVRIEKKVDTINENVNNIASKKIDKKDALVTSGILSGSLFFLSLIINGHIAPHEIPSWIKAALGVN